MESRKRTVVRGSRNERKNRRGKYRGLIYTLMFLVVMVGSTAWLTFAQARQERLGRALIAAIKRINTDEELYRNRSLQGIWPEELAQVWALRAKRGKDTDEVLDLLAEGADPNVRDVPSQPLPFWRLLLHMLPGKHPAASTAPTPLLLALEPTDGIGVFHREMCYMPEYADTCSEWGELGLAYNDPTFPRENPHLIEALLDSGADANAAGDEGTTPLFWAALTCRQKRILQLLLEHGANVNAPGSSGMTPFLVTCDNPYLDLDVIHSMLDRGAIVNTMVDGRTPLTCAVGRRCFPLAQLLLQHHANPQFITKGGVTTLALAKSCKDRPWKYGHSAEALASKQIIQMLQQAGAKE